ncbi:MAG: hypothetical protein R2879_04425 [Saprospiraceae bacterium]
MDDIKIEKVKAILTNWNPLGERAKMVHDLDNYNTEAIDILFHLDGKPRLEQVEKMTREILEESFNIYLSKEDVLPYAKQIHEVLKGK